MSTTQLAKVLSNPHLMDMDKAPEAVQAITEAMETISYTRQVRNPAREDENAAPHIDEQVNKLDDLKKFPILKKAFDDHAPFWASIGVNNLETLASSDGWLAMNELIALVKMQTIGREEIPASINNPAFLTHDIHGVEYELKYKRLLLTRLVINNVRDLEQEGINALSQHAEILQLEFLVDKFGGEDNFPSELKDRETFNLVQSAINTVRLEKKINSLLESKKNPFLLQWFASLPKAEQDSILGDKERLGGLLTSTNEEELRTLLRLKTPVPVGEYDNGYVTEAFLKNILTANSANQPAFKQTNNALNAINNTFLAADTTVVDKLNALAKLKVGRFMLEFLEDKDQLTENHLENIFQLLSRTPPLSKHAFLQGEIGVDADNELLLINLIPKAKRERFKAFLTEGKLKEFQAQANKSTFLDANLKTTVDTLMASTPEEDKKLAAIEKLSKDYFSSLEKLYNFSMKWGDSAYGLSAKAKAKTLLEEYEKLAQNIAHIRDELSHLKQQYDVLLEQFNLDKETLEKWADSPASPSDKKECKKQVKYLEDKKQILDKKFTSINKMTEQFKRLEEALYGKPHEAKKTWRLGILNYLREAVHHPKIYRSSYAPFTYEDFPISQLEAKLQAQVGEKAQPDPFSVENISSSTEVNATTLLPQIPKGHCRLYTGKFGSGGVVGKILEEKIPGHGNAEVAKGKTRYPDKTRLKAIEIPDKDTAEEARVEYFLKIIHDMLSIGQHPTVTPLALSGSEEDIRWGKVAALLLGEVEPTFKSEHLRLGSARVEKGDLKWFHRVTNTEMRIFQRHKTLIKTYQDNLRDFNKVRYNTKGEFYSHSKVKKELQSLQKKVEETSNKLSPGAGG